MIELLRTVPLFQSFSHSQLESIAALCQTKTYKVGTILFHENEVGTVFYIVISGSVKIYTTDLKTRAEKILEVFGAGEAFGELALLDGKPRSATAQAIEDTQVLSLTTKDFSNLMRSHFDITMSIVKELCGRLRSTNRQVHDLTFLDAKERVIKNLISLANKHGSRRGHTIDVHLKLNRDELAQMAGVPHDLLSQVFKDLQNKQILSFTEHQFSLNLANLKRNPDNR